ncbi:MAG: serine/threonine protein kinase [Solirubrobacterales bacterium]|nr:serine/threonine protein kinase [Solirubrobacterales bacterium]
MLLDERTGVEAPPAPPTPRTCAHCGSEIADVQEWCLECGERQPGRGRWTLRLAALVVTGVIALAGAGSALAYVALRDDANNQSSRILAEKPPASPAAPTTASASTQPPPAGTTTGTTTPPTGKGRTTGKAPPLIPVVVHPRGGSTPAAANAGATNGTGGGSSGASNAGAGTNQGGTQTTAPKRVKTTPKRPPDQSQRYAKGFSPTNAIDYDPFGDGHENPGDVRSAIDRNLGTSWSTADYPNGLGKSGVGLFVDAGAEVNLRAIEIATSTPGWGVSIYGNASYPSGPMPGNGWQLVAQGSVGSAQSAIGLGGAGTNKFEYYLVWITSLPAGSTHATISEVTLLGAQSQTG